MSRGLRSVLFDHHCIGSEMKRYLSYLESSVVPRTSNHAHEQEVAIDGFSSLNDSRSSLYFCI